MHSNLVPILHQLSIHLYFCINHKKWSFRKCYILLYGIRPPLLAAIETSANIAKVPRAVAKLIRIVLPVRHLHLQKIEIVFPVYVTLYNCLSISDGEDP